jgi:predicted nucleic acid-binding protein
VRFVLDASVALSWLLKDAGTGAKAYAFDVLNLLGLPEMQADVPVTWALEISNVLARSEAKSLVTQAQSEAFLELIHATPISIDVAAAAYALFDTLHLARRYRLSSYDASYLELALRQGLGLATLDADLRRAAEKAGVAQVALS